MVIPRSVKDRTEVEAMRLEFGTSGGAVLAHFYDLIDCAQLASRLARLLALLSADDARSVRKHLLLVTTLLVGIVG
jgi:hypothetical protein